MDSRNYQHIQDRHVERLPREPCLEGQRSWWCIFVCRKRLRPFAGCEALACEGSSPSIVNLSQKHQKRSPAGQVRSAWGETEADGDRVPVCERSRNRGNQVSLDCQSFDRRKSTL